MGKFRRVPLPRARERANLSFFIVIIFFAIFTIIVLTEIFLIDERGRNSMGLGSRGHHTSRRHHNTHDYDEGQVIVQEPGFIKPHISRQAEDYIVYHAGIEDNARAGDNVKPRLIGGAHYEPPFAARQGIMPRNVESRLPPMPNVTASPGSWQNVPGTRYKFYVFSAYYDWRVTRLVRVIGATKTRGPERVWCRLWSSNNSTSVTVPGKVKVIRENWNLKYSACFILCPLRENQTVPSSVSVVSRLRVLPNNHLRVYNMQKRLQITTTAGSVPSNYSNIKMAVCVKPIHFNYNRAIQMMEFLEMNALLGVSHFTLYNDTMSPSTSCLLHDYVSRGLVTILPWKLDMVSQREIRTEGLFAALNDCLYRSMYLYTHVALIDLDEFIMPRHNDTLPQFIQWMNTRMNTRTGSYSFQNAFFYLQWPDDSSLTNTDEFEANLITLRKTRRKAKLHPHKQRSKYICRPEFVVEAGNHFVWEFIPGHGTLNVPADAAILNHYRVCEFGGDDCVKSVSVVDKTALRYKKKLVGNIRKKWNELKDKCGFDELKPRVLPKIKL